MRASRLRLILCAVVAQLAGVAGASGTGRGGAALAAALVGAGAVRAEGGGAAMAAWTAVIVGATGVGADQYCGAGSYFDYSLYYTCRSCPAVSQSHLFAYNMCGDAHTDPHFHTITGVLLYFDGC